MGDSLYYLDSLLAAADLTNLTSLCTFGPSSPPPPQKKGGARDSRVFPLDIFERQGWMYTG